MVLGCEEQGLRVSESLRHGALGFPNQGLRLLGLKNGALRITYTVFGSSL